MELEIAQSIVNIAKEKRYITGPLSMAPELAESEKPLLSMILTETRKHVESKPEQHLEFDEINSMFLYVYAKAIETVYNWHEGSDYLPTEDGLFGGKVPFLASEAMQKHFQKLPLAEDLFGAFQNWTDENSDYCEVHGTHPILPIIEALKWTYRISMSLSLQFLGYEA